MLRQRETYSAKDYEEDNARCPASARAKDASAPISAAASASLPPTSEKFCSIPAVKVSQSKSLLALCLPHHQT